MTTGQPTLNEIMDALLDTEAKKRMWGIIALAKRNDATLNSVMLVGRLLHDGAIVEPNPSTYGHSTPQFELSVEYCAQLSLPYIAKRSPGVIAEVARNLATTTTRYDQKIASEIISLIGPSAVAKALINCDENELITVSSLLGKYASSSKPIVASFRAPPEQRASELIRFMATQGRRALTDFTEELYDLGPKAIPFLSEIIRFNAEHPYRFGFGSESIFNFGSTKYRPALRAVAILERLGPQSTGALTESSRSSIDKIRLASEKALRRLKVVNKE